VNNKEPSSNSNQIKSLQPKFRTQFHKQVLVKLLEIVTISKQQEPQTHKKEIHQHLDEIALLGRKAQLSNWGEVLATAKRAVNDENKDYQHLIKVIVQEIKNVAELVLEDQCEQITVSQTLKELTTKSATNGNTTNLRDKIDTQTRKNTSSHKYHRELPQVDAEDLNSLADVFETSNELEENWHTGEILGSNGLSDPEHSSTTTNQEESDEFNDLFAEELSLISIDPKKDKQKRTLDYRETSMLFGEDFSFNTEEMIENPFDKETEITSLDMEDNLSLDEPVDLLTKLATSATEEEDLESAISKMFEEDFSLEEEKQKQEKKRINAGKDTMLLFGEDFSFEDNEVETENKTEIQPQTIEVKSGEVFGDELSLLTLKPKSRKAKKQPTGSKDTTNLFGKDFTFNLDEPQKEGNKHQDDLDINDLFGDEVLSTNKDDLASDINDLFEEQEIASSSDDFEELFDSFEDTTNTSTRGEIDLSELEPIIEEDKKEIIYFYDSWEELDNSIAEFLETATVFNADILLSLIEAPVVPTSGEIPSQFTEDEDYDFAELEEMLQQSVPNLSGSGTMINNPAANKSAFEQTMKVPVKQLDNLNNLMGELVVNKNSLEQDQEKMRQFLENLLNHVGNLSDVGSRMQDLYERNLLENALLATREGVRHGNTVNGQNGDSSDPHDDYDPLEMDRFSGFHLLSQEMIELIVRVRESSSDIQFLVDETEQVSRNLRQITSQLQEGLNKARMVSFAETADRMRAAVRRVSVQLKKKAELVAEGREVLIDKMIAEHLFDPMTHLINNALTHGIETPEERVRKGKNPIGQVNITAYVQGNQTIITVSDDGAGINGDVIKRKAIEKGLISKYQSQIMNEKQVFDLIFHAGFSTKEQADDFAGRGVGMDVVRTALNEIRGTISIDSVIDKGTTFTIRLPLMLTISKALCCLSSHHRIAFPMDGVEDMQDFFPAEIKTNDQGDQIIPWRNHLIPFKPLTDLLKYNRQIGRANVYGGKREDDMISIVILRSGNSFFAVQVDQVLGEQEIVIKQIQGPVPKPPGITGATVLGDGRIMGIVDVLELFDIAQGKIRHEVGGLWDSLTIEPAESEVRTEPMVLVVDDSITVRGMLSMTFTKAGYRVEEARDGQEAWDKLRSGLPCDMVFCDIEMPRMDGLQLLSKILEDEELNHLPVAMLTSRGAEKHKQMAAKLGASAYFTKPYLEESLLDGAGRMMKGEVLLVNSTRKPGKHKSKSQQILEEEQNLNSSGVISSIEDIPTVLIIDDSVVVRELLSSTFQNAGYQVEQARDGQEAWDKLNDNLHCNVIFCDIEMPRMNGLDLLVNLQNNERLNKIPVAMLTSRGAERHRRMAAERGAKGYFTKPYMDEVLLEAAQKLMKGEVLIPVNS
jgi:chemosensory pili system protein ChpA (sensor histidine kinase/response regulator)